MVIHSGSQRAVDPLPQLAFAKSPLPADFDRRNLLTLRPETKSSGRDAQPFRDCGGGQKGFWSGQQFLHARPLWEIYTSTPRGAYAVSVRLVAKTDYDCFAVSF